MYKVMMLLILACVVVPGWAGMAYPSASKAYVTDLFKKVNPDIEWDQSNYVVDLSGYHAQCDYVSMDGVSYESTRTRDGEVITVIQDSGTTKAAHVNAVNDAIPPIMEDWPETYRAHIRHAEKFGCSVEPSCNGRMSIACLFAPSLNEPKEPDYEDKTDDRTANPSARAFTEEQYVLAEKITGTKWDRNHFLENLSGYDIDCDMIGRTKWTYVKATTIAGDREMAVRGSFGSTENKGETEPAMKAILKELYKPPAGSVGCSILPDCMKEDQMFVVVSCVFEA